MSDLDGKKVRVLMLALIQQIGEIRQGGIKPPKILAECDGCTDQYNSDVKDCYPPSELRWRENPTADGYAMDSGWYCGGCRELMDGDDEG